MGVLRAVWGKMATKSKLEQAVEKKASSLNDAQKELVLSQFSVYKRNKARIAEIEDVLRISSCTPSTDRSNLATERNQLTIANNEIAAKLFQQLKD